MLQVKVWIPGFEWLTPAGFVAGLVVSIVYGAFAGGLFAWIHNAAYRRVVAAP